MDRSTRDNKDIKMSNWQPKLSGLRLRVQSERVTVRVVSQDGRRVTDSRTELYILVRKWGNEISPKFCIFFVKFNSIRNTNKFLGFIFHLLIYISNKVESLLSFIGDLKSVCQSFGRKLQLFTLAPILCILIGWHSNIYIKVTQI